MAAGPVTVLNVAMEKIGSGAIDLASDSFVVVLTTSTQALSASFVGTSGQALYSDLTNEVTGSGYTAGGAPLTASDWTRASAVVSFTADATSWTAITATMKYAVICSLDGSLDPEHILAVVDLELTDPSGRTSVGGDFIINWSSALFTLTRAA